MTWQLHWAIEARIELDSCPPLGLHCRGAGEHESVAAAVRRRELIRGSHDSAALSGEVTAS